MSTWEGVQRGSCASSGPEYRGAVPADDVSQLATNLKLEKVLVVAAASGAPYALALSALLPDRVQGTLLLSPLHSAGALPLSRSL